MQKLNNELENFNKKLNKNNEQNLPECENAERELENISDIIEEIIEIKIKEDQNLSNSLKNCNKSESFLDKNQKIFKNRLIY